MKISETMKEEVAKELDLIYERHNRKYGNRKMSEEEIKEKLWLRGVYFFKFSSRLVILIISSIN